MMKSSSRPGNAAILNKVHTALRYVSTADRNYTSEAFRNYKMGPGQPCLPRWHVICGVSLLLRGEIVLWEGLWNPSAEKGQHHGKHRGDLSVSSTRCPAPSWPGGMNLVQVGRNALSLYWCFSSSVVSGDPRLNNKINVSLLCGLTPFFFIWFSVYRFTWGKKRNLRFKQ